MTLLFAAGALSMVAQVVVLRELVAALYGVELLYVLALGSWLVGTAFGSAAGRHVPAAPGAGIAGCLALGLLVPLEMGILRAAGPAAGAVTGAYLPFPAQLLWMDAVVGAFGLDGGAARAFARATGYRPPPCLDTLVTKLHPAGRDPIPGIKAKAQALGIPIAIEIVTKRGSVDVSSEVAKLRRAKPDFVIFHGYVLAPIPEFIRQMREAGLSSRGMGTIYSMDKTTIDQMGATGAGFLGVMPYRYSFDTQKTPTMELIREGGSKWPGDACQTAFYTQGLFRFPGWMNWWRYPWPARRVRRTPPSTWLLATRLGAIAGLRIAVAGVVGPVACGR